MQNRDSKISEVIVVGAGPVGLVTALLLANADVPTIVVEKANQPGDLPRAISLQDESFRIFEQLGLADALKEDSLLDTGSRYFGLNDVLLAEARPVPSRIGHPAKSQFDQPDLEHLLFDRARAHPNIDLRLGTEAVALLQDTDHVTLRVRNQTTTTNLTARYLVGADGGRSYVRSAVGIQMMGSTQPQRWIVIDILNDDIRRDPFAEFHCDGKRPYVLVPGAKGRLRLEFMLFDDEDGATMTTPDMVRDLMKDIRPGLQDKDVRRAAVYVAHQRVAESYRANRVFLAGDAAHLMPPFAGQGLNAGVRDASNIAWKLIEVLRGGATEKFLDTYDMERREHGRRMMLISQRVGAVVMATNAHCTRLRDRIILSLRKAPAVHSYFANMRFITPPDYSAGLSVPCVRRKGPLRGATVGRILPQPRVKDLANDSISGLDQYLGNGWSVLALGDACLDQLAPYFSHIGAREIHIAPYNLSDARGAESAPGRLQEIEPVLVDGSADEGLFVLVRPDRYVAAVFTPAEQKRVVADLRTYIDDRVREPDLA